MKRTLLIAVALVGLGGCTKQEAMPEGASTPTSAAKPDPTARLATLSAGAPTFLYFVKDTCGSNPQAVPLYTKLITANKGKAKIIGVINADEAGFKSWSQTYNTGIEFVCDPEMTLMRKYQVQTSQTVVLVGADQKEQKRFEGFGKDALVPLNAAIGGSAPAKVDLMDAPDRPSYG